jgi:hypothetical protein
MKLNVKASLLAGAVAVAATGAAFANTTIAPGSTGDGSLFLNVVDTTSQTSYTLDLSAVNSSDHVKGFAGVSGAPQSFTLNDANWASFTSSIAAGDNVVYDVIGGITTVGANQFTFTSSATVGNTTNQQLKNNNVDAFINAVNSSTSTSAISLFASAAANGPAYAGSALQTAAGVPGTFSSVGTAVNFYNLSLNGTANLNKAKVTTYTGTWDLTNLSTLTYSVSSVPLPMPLTLLLSGLALMGVIARRGKSQSSDISLSGAAA